MDKIASFFSSKMSPDEEREVEALNQKHAKQMEALFAFFEALEKHRDELKDDVRQLEADIAAAKAAPSGPPLPDSPQCRLGNVEMSEDDAVDYVAETMQFSTKYSSMK